jgi:hypothetical protein
VFSHLLLKKIINYKLCTLVPLWRKFKKMKNEENKPEFLFDKVNYKILLIGLAIIAIGFILMTGGGTEDPNTFDEEALFSFRRIRLAPTVVLAGFGVTIYSIMKNPLKK